VSYPPASSILIPANRFAAATPTAAQPAACVPSPGPVQHTDSSSCAHPPVIVPPALALQPASGDSATFGGWGPISDASKQTFKAFLSHPNTQLGGGMLLKTGIPLALVVMGMPLKIFPLNELFTLAAVGISHQSGKLGSSLLKDLHPSQFDDSLGKTLYKSSKVNLIHLLAAPGTPESMGVHGQTKFQNLLSDINRQTQRLLRALPVPPEMLRFAKGFISNLDIGPHNLGWMQHIPWVGGAIKNTLESYAGFRSKVMATEGHDELLRMMRKGVYKKFLRLAEPKNNWFVDRARDTIKFGMWNTRSILDAAHEPTMRAAYGKWWKNFTNEIGTLLTAKSLESVVKVVAGKLPPFIGAPLIWMANLADGAMKLIFNTK
jgi:hypothetical protein